MLLHDDEVSLKNIVGMDDGDQLPIEILDSYERFQRIWHRHQSGPMENWMRIMLVVICDGDRIAKRQREEDAASIPDEDKKVLDETLEKANEKVEDKRESVGGVVNWENVEKGRSVLAIQEGMSKFGTYLGPGKKGFARVTFKGDDKEFRHIPLSEVRLADKVAVKS